MYNDKNSIALPVKVIMDTVLDGMITINEKGTVLSFNPAAERIFQYTPEEVIGKNVKVLMADPYHSEHDQYLINYLTSGEKKVIGIGREVSAKRKDGSVFPMELGVNETELGDNRIFVGTIRDISDRKKAEEEFVAEANHHQAVLNTVLDGLITIDQYGTIQSFNPAAERIFQYSPEEVIGKNVKILMPEPYHSEHDQYLVNYLTSGEKKVIGIGREVSAKRKDGSVFPMELGVNIINSDDEHMFVGTIRDISDRKKAEGEFIAEANRLQAVLNTVLDGLITIDQYGEIYSFNPAAEKIFQYSAEDVIGKNVKLLMPNPYHDGHDQYLTNYLETGDKKVIGVGRQVMAQRKDGVVFPIELGVNEMSIEGRRMFVGTIRDITERVESEEAIKSYLEKLKRSNQELDDFAYIASHDLKEPLRGLSNNAIFLEEDYEEVLDEGGKRRLIRMKYLCKRLENLVDDLLYYSRLGRQELAIQEVNLNVLINDIELMMENSLKESNAEIIIPQLLPNIICDVPRITEVFRNLITNAVKYNDKERKIIEVGCTNNTSEKYKNTDIIQTFYVKDNGVGIEESFFNDVFRIFKRLNSENDDVKGTGVGLTFVKKIIERHEGRIWIESEVGSGTTFYFNLNLKENS